MMNSEADHTGTLDDKEDGVREAPEQSAANAFVSDRVHQRSIGDLLEGAINASDERFGPACRAWYSRASATSRAARRPTSSAWLIAI
jgi:hypothetical protein